MAGSLDEAVVLWRRLDLPGHDFCSLSIDNAQRCLDGTAVFSYGQKPCRLDYSVRCSKEWRTRSGRIEGWVGNEHVEIKLYVDSAQHWRLNGISKPEVEGCVDLDLSFSPSTNILPIRRSAIPVGRTIEARAAWLRFPEFTLEPLEQRYHRIDLSNYQYDSAGGSFSALLQVSRTGFIFRYPDLWEIESSF
jgi:uncharacterized protein